MPSIHQIEYPHWRTLFRISCRIHWCTWFYPTPCSCGDIYDLFDIRTQKFSHSIYCNLHILKSLLMTRLTFEATTTSRAPIKMTKQWKWLQLTSWHRPGRPRVPVLTAKVFGFRFLIFRQTRFRQTRFRVCNSGFCDSGSELFASRSTTAAAATTTAIYCCSSLSNLLVFKR